MFIRLWIFIKYSLFGLRFAGGEENTKYLNDTRKKVYVPFNNAFWLKPKRKKEKKWKKAFLIKNTVCV